MVLLEVAVKSRTLFLQRSLTTHLVGLLQALSTGLTVFPEKSTKLNYIVYYVSYKR